MGLVNWATSPSFQSVYGPMTPSDNAEAIGILQTNGIEYRLEQGTGLLEVPFDEVFQARMVLASEGFPKDGSGIGFESLYLEQEMGIIQLYGGSSLPQSGRSRAGSHNHCA